jgi:hypothetical protein
LKLKKKTDEKKRRKEEKQMYIIKGEDFCFVFNFSLGGHRERLPNYSFCLLLQNRYSKEAEKNKESKLKDKMKVVWA